MNPDRIFKVLLCPHITEKAALAVKTNQYVFKVASNATKTEIRKVVEALFSKKVVALQVLNMRSCRKAYVTLAPGEKIDIGYAS